MNYLDSKIGIIDSKYNELNTEYFCEGKALTKSLTVKTDWIISYNI